MGEPVGSRVKALAKAGQRQHQLHQNHRGGETSIPASLGKLTVRAARALGFGLTLGL
jgi:glutathione synthase/RimK-type ligase-like ATP-grasp enzyme